MNALRGAAGARALLLARVTAIVTALAACTSAAERIDAHLRKGERAVHAADWDTAGVEARNVLQIAPRHPQGWQLAARVAEGRGDLPRAWAAWSQAVELAPAEIDPALGRARVQLLAGDLEGADAAIAALRARDATNPGVRTLAAAAMARHGRTADAIDEARAILSAPRPVPAEARLLLAGLWLQHGEPLQALAIAEQALGTAPDDLSLLIVAARIAGRAASAPGAAASATAYHRRAVALAPRRTALWTDWAADHLARGELDAAEGVLREALQDAPRDPARRLAWLDFLSSRRGFAAAEQAHREAVAAFPDDMPVRFSLATLLQRHGHAMPAAAVWREIALRDGDHAFGTRARNALAAQAFAAGETTQALAWLEEVLRAHPRDGEALTLRGRIRLVQGRAGEAVVDLRSVLHDQPGAPAVAGLLAQAHRAAGAPQLARDVLAEAVNFQPLEPALHLLLAADLADHREDEAARAEIDTAIRLAPADPRGPDAKARLALARGDLAGAEGAWRAWLTVAPQDGSAWLSVAGLRLLRHDAAGAQRVLDEAQRQHPDELAIQDARAEWLARSHRREEAIAAYEAVLARAPQDETAANNLACLLAEGDADPARLARAEALARGFEEATDPQRLDTLGWVRYRLGRHAAAAALLERALALAPGDAGVALRLGMARHRAGDAARGDALIRGALARDPSLSQAAEARGLLR